MNVLFPLFLIVLGYHAGGKFSQYAGVWHGYGGYSPYFRTRIKPARSCVLDSVVFVVTTITKDM